MHTAGPGLDVAPTGPRTLDPTPYHPQPPSLTPQPPMARPYLRPSLSLSLSLFLYLSLIAHALSLSLSLSLSRSLSGWQTVLVERMHTAGPGLDVAFQTPHPTTLNLHPLYD